MTMLSDRRVPNIASNGSREAIWMGIAWYLTGVVLWWFGAFSEDPYEAGAKLPALAATFVEGVMVSPPP